MNTKQVEDILRSAVESAGGRLVSDSADSTTQLQVFDLCVRRIAKKGHTAMSPAMYGILRDRFVVQLPNQSALETFSGRILSAFPCPLSLGFAPKGIAAAENQNFETDNWEQAAAEARSPHCGVRTLDAAA